MPTIPIDAETRASGGPVEDPDHDDFERVKYAQRIAETLIKRRSQKSIVIGLYGKWGEGKSSVLHFIRRSLAEAPNQVAVLNFNPWRFSDETQLLVNFFGELMKIIGQNLLTNKQRAFEGLSSYVAPLIPSVTYNDVSMDFSKGLESLLKKAQPEVDEQRKRVETLIAESDKRVVVIIDDIDRLEKSQIQAIFRLVKLTADFDHTSYLLSFDDEMVARAIGEVFAANSDDATGSRTLLAGQNFLEKIIQVPLRLPLARPDDLLQFCWNRLHEAFTETETSLTEEEKERLVSSLRSAILPQLTTPRLAVRFANAVQFGLPLLRGEVNTVDQVLVEAMHIFFSQLHQFVATHESIFTGGSQPNNAKKTFAAEYKKLIDDALKSYEGDSYRAGLSLLCILFPFVNRLYNGIYSQAVLEETLTKRKAVGAPSHFARYFAYSVVRGDVSDITFDVFLEEMNDNQLRAAENLTSRLGISRFMQKIQYRIQDLTSEQASNLWGVVASLSLKINKNLHGTSIELVSSHERQAAELLCAMLMRIDESSKRSQLIESLIITTGTFQLAEEMQRQLIGWQTLGMSRDYFEEVLTPTSLFNEQEWQRLVEAMPQLFLSRALVDAGPIPLFKLHPFNAFKMLFVVWPRSDQRPNVVTYVQEFLSCSPDYIHDFIAICSEIIGIYGEMFLANITAQKVAKVTELFGSDIYDRVRQKLGDEQVTTYPGEENSPEQPTPEDRLRQFVYLYERNEASTDAPTLAA